MTTTIYREKFFPFLTDYATINRSKCSTCTEFIRKHDHRMGLNPREPFRDVFDTKWYHLNCFFEKRNIQRIQLIKNIDIIRTDDQKLIKTLLADNSYYIEHTNNGNPVCAKCHEKICEEVFIFGKDSKNEAIEEDFIYCYHVECFLKIKAEVLENPSTFDLTSIRGFNELEDRHQEYVKNKFKSGNPLIPNSKLLELEQQNDELWRLWDSLKGIPIRYFTSALEQNAQHVEKGLDNVLHDLCDCLTFGRMNPCQACGGRLSYDSYGYKCNAYFNEWARCNFRTKVVTRSRMEISLQGRNYNVLRNNNSGTAVRLLCEELMCTQLGYPISNDISLPEQVNVILQGAAAVQPNSDVQDDHVYQDEDTQDPMTAILVKVGTANGKNSFYVFQVLESDEKNKWFIFKFWGRIGTTIEEKILKSFTNRDVAVEHFKQLYREKTGFSWHNRHESDKQVNMFFPIDLSFKDESPGIICLTPFPSVFQLLMHFLYECELSRNALEIDLNRMPLGILSETKIDTSSDPLSELYDLIMNVELTSILKLFDVSTRFYTLTPHNFGRRAPPVIESLDLIKTESEAIDYLKEFKIHLNIVNDTDTLYQNLGNTITVLDRESVTFSRIVKYLHNSHPSTQRFFEIEVIEIFDIGRENKVSKCDLPNRMMLWHGSSGKNWPRIIHGGLNNPALHSDGDTFGGGIYFADVVTTSAWFSKPQNSLNEGMLALCEVALGTTATLATGVKSITLKQCEHSCKATGTIHPNQGENVVDEDGVVYPMGTLIDEGGHEKGLLRHNEYIVYNADQVRQRYLLSVKFNYEKEKANV